MNSPLRKRILVRVTLFTSLVMAVAGCTLPPSLQEAFGTQTGRTRQLGERVVKFHKAINWGMPEQALDFVSPKVQGNFVDLVIGDEGEKRIVDVSVAKIDYDVEHDPSKAKVEAVIRFFRVPNMIVETRRARETWEFSQLDGGWQFLEAESVKEQSAESATIGGFMR